MHALKDTFTQKWNCSHYLFTPMLMESQMKSCTILLNTWSRWGPWDTKLIWKDWIYTLFLATIFTAPAYLKVLRRTLSEVHAGARLRGLNIAFSNHSKLECLAFWRPVLQKRCMLPFYYFFKLLFYVLKQVHLSSLGECCKAILLSSSRNVFLDKETISDFLSV